MQKRRSVPGRNKGRRWLVVRLLIVIGVLAAAAGSVWWLRSGGSSDSPARPQSGETLREHGPPTPLLSNLSDEYLQRAADQLLTLSDPERSENAYFPAFVRNHLRWLARENRANRLEVAFLTEASNGPLPPDVLMAASQLNGTPAIFIAKARFAKFLLEAGTMEPPFTQQQKNDFALALVHEVVHLRNPAADPRDLDRRSAEEARVWREVSLEVVRPFRSLNQPLHRRFLDVDDALRTCSDVLPCPPLLRLVRTRP